MIPGRFFRLTVFEFRQETEDFYVEPDEGDEESEGRVPFHVLGRFEFLAFFDEVEVEHKVHRGDEDDERAERDAHESGTVDEAEVEPAGKVADHAHEVHEEYAPGGRGDAELEVLGGFYPAGLVGYQKRREDPEGERGSLWDDARVLGLEHRRYEREEHAFGYGVRHREIRRSLRKEADDERDNECYGHAHEYVEHGDLRHLRPSEGGRCDDQSNEDERLVDRAFHGHFGSGSVGIGIDEDVGIERGVATASEVHGDGVRGFEKAYGNLREGKASNCLLRSRSPVAVLGMRDGFRGGESRPGAGGPI